MSEAAAPAVASTSASPAPEDKPPIEFVKLISAEGHEFIIEKRAAMISNTIKNMLNTPGTFVENARGQIELPDISTPVLEKVCQYFHYKLRFSNTPPPFQEFKIEPEITLELMMAANFLDT
eukprot:tig00020675_g12677.t1